MNKTGILHFKNREKKPIELTFSSTGIRTNDSEFPHLIPYHSLNLEIGGANKHLFFFKPLDKNEYCFQIYIDKESREYIKNLDHLSWKETLHNFQRKEITFYSLIAIACFICLFLIYGLFQTRSILAGKIARSIPYKTEQQIGERLVSVMMPSSKTIKDTKALAELEKMLDPIVNVLPEKFKDIHFYIADDKSLNAFAMPGGNIVINRGLLEKSESDLEVIGVVAHELAHITERHVLRSMVQGAGIFLIIQTILGDMTGLITVLSDQGSFLLSQSFSRDMETEADQVGHGYLLKAGIPTTGLISFFEKIIKENEKILGEELSNIDFSFLSTHPDTENRIIKIKKMIEEQDQKFDYNKDFLKTIKTRLKVTL